MDPSVIYKILHLTGVIILFGSLGASIYTPSSKNNKLAAILHGISLLLLLVSGFGMLARLYGGQFHWWMIAKLVIWLCLGGSYALAKKRLLPENTAFAIILGLGILAAILGNSPALGIH